MRLISLVIIKHSFLGNLILNFGGSWILKFNNGRIDREKNDLFIDGFYDSHNYLTLVSAIVGKNGSGKSTIFEILRYSINNKSGYNAILVFEDIHRNVYTSVTKSHNLMDIVLNENPNSDEIQNQENLPEFLFDIQDYSEQLRSIFYSPFLDLKADILTLAKVLILIFLYVDRLPMILILMKA